MSGVEKFFLPADDAVLVIIDIQERLASAMEEKEKVIRNTIFLIELAKLFNIPVVVTEQYPKGLGNTVPELKEMLPEYAPVVKLTFDCCGESNYVNIMKGKGRKKAIVAGMETHVCVLQTVLSLLRDGYDVHLVSDAVCSRNAVNKRTALEMLASAGAVITCTETVLFQVMKIAGTEEFRKISKMIK
jgi:nicotinamidase-related amidase